MNEDKRHTKDKRNLPHPPLKPKHADTKGAPDDENSSAQYEVKDES